MLNEEVLLELYKTTPVDPLENLPEIQRAVVKSCRSGFGGYTVTLIVVDKDGNRLKAMRRYPKYVFRDSIKKVRFLMGNLKSLGIPEEVIGADIPGFNCKVTF